MKPITTRAKCKYKSKYPQMEVTIDAGGKIPANFPSTSPMKKMCGCKKMK